MTLRRYSVLKRGRVKKSNPKRRASEFKRCYGSKARVEFVKSLPCAACGIVGYSENAHVLGNGGLSRKGNYTGIAPLCGFRPGVGGCHELHDSDHWIFVADFAGFNPEKAASETEQAWQAFTSGRAAK